MSELTTLLITAEHVRDGVYVGPDVSDITGHIEIAADLGWLTFQGGIKASGRIQVRSGALVRAARRSRRAACGDGTGGVVAGERQS